MRALFGREPELARAREAIDRAKRGEGAFWLVTGEAGIGKSRLCREVADLAAGAGAAVAWGRCWEAGGAPAYWPWIEVFRTLGIDPLARSARADPGPAEERFLLFDRAASALEAAARERPLVVLLDDLHVADPPSLLLLLFVAREIVRRAPLLIVGTARPVEARAAEEIGPLLARIAREAAAVPLRRLGVDDVADWVAQDASSGALVADVFRVTEGNPLFVEELMRVGARGPGAAPPDGIATILDEHLARLSAPAREMLELAAVLGREISIEQIARAGDRTLDGVAAAVREGVRAGVVGDGERGLAFTHVLLRDRLYDALAPSARASLHWSAGQRLAESSTDPLLATHHLLAGAGAGQPGVAARAALEAASTAERQLAFELAAELCERALGLPSSSADAEVRAELTRVLGTCRIRMGRADEGRAACVRAASIARDAALPRSLARAALAYATDFATGALDPVMLSLLREALAGLQRDPDEALRIRVTARLSAGLVPPAREEDGIEILALARGAIAAARAFGDPDTLLYALVFGGSGIGYTVPMEERFAIVAETATLARSLGADLVGVNASAFHALTLFEQGRGAEAEVAAADCIARAEALPVPSARWRATALRASVALLHGRFDEVERLSVALQEASEAMPGLASIAWALLRIGVAQSRGQPDLVATDAGPLLAILGRSSGLVPYAGWVLAAVGRRDEAVERLRTVADFPASFPWLVIAGELAVLVGDPELSARAYDKLAGEGSVGRIFWGPCSTVLGPAARTLGDLARALGRHEAARRHYEEAADLCRRIGAAPLLALTERGLAALPAAGSRPPAPPVAAGTPVFRREGDVWAIEPAAGATVRVKHSKGVAHLALLVESPGRDFHVLALLGAEHEPGDSGPVLDARARQEYRTRADALGEELREAEAFGDLGRQARAREELDVLAEQLAGAVGLGGRERRAGAQVERARINVQRRIKDAIEAIGRADPALGRYLAATVRTGMTCSFTPL